MGKYLLEDYLEISFSDARAQWRRVLSRRPSTGSRQEAFLPIETLLCTLAATVVDHNRYGSSTAHLAPEPIQQMARLFVRPPSSPLAKIANVLGSRSHGATFDVAVGLRLLGSRDSGLQFRIYQTVMSAARAEGVGRDALGDFLAMESDQTGELFGQDELSGPEVGSFVEDEVRNLLSRMPELSEAETERAVLARIRIGQNKFARGVLENFAGACAFCGMENAKVLAPRMLVASHIKPWKDSIGYERVDVANGLAACPSHDVAFDSGLITVDVDFHIRMSDRLTMAAQKDAAMSAMLGRPPLRQTLLLPESAVKPGKPYLEWHKDHLFQAA